MQKNILAAIVIFSCFFSTVWANEPKTVAVKKETNTFDLDLKYPQGFANETIDETVKKFINETQQADANPDANEDVNAPGKNSLYVDYKIKFQNKNAVSLLFTVSVNHRGAAHPNNSVKTFNFLNGQEISLSDLFKSDSNYLKKISTLSRAELIKKKISDDNWIISGTSPKEDNYRNWYFTEKGLTIVFDTYQVAAYVYGPQEIEIAKSTLIHLLRPEIAKLVWGNA
ncbi:DUF3298/DUF4163 domain-containing protein [Legionella jordanis]|uniref:DUF3298 and DUF4163 domain-containing protein n=1 Tax=Legionella jordanis TaxID=456 RepID=UPI000EFF30D7|nr:DUF3298 and DUF4163 domain-containing protein [Legionella jordanis]RMX22057.1 DUF3298/DUF4163 domain-containing protein [Legionella jordanis]